MKRIWSTATLLAVIAAPLPAQRVIESHHWSDDEGRLMGYYSAALTFTPLGTTIDANGSLGFGVELAYVPPLSMAERTAGGSKTESTNLAPFAARPRLSYVLPGGVRAEASWIPPVKVFEITANLVSVAFERDVATWGNVRLTPRISGSTGSVKGAVTCNNDLATSSPGNQTYYAYVCHGRESADRFLPSALTGELVARGTAFDGALRPYGGIGVRAEHTQFEVNLFYADGREDTQHPTLDLHIARPYGFVGTALNGPRRTALTGELFYAPGSLVTVRVMALWRLWEGETR